MRAIPLSCASRPLFNQQFTLHLRDLHFTLAATLVLAVLLSASMRAQNAAQPASVRPLITQAIDESQLTRLKGNTHPLARAEYDLGTAPASLPMQRMLLVLKRSPDQEVSLRKRLDDQQDKASPNYHKWLTPEQYGQQYGPTDADMQTITAWLQSHGFQVGTTKGRTVLEFSGTAGQVQEAFHTAMHKYIVNGEQHWANASDPMIPTALTGAVGGVLTLHNFIKKPAIQFNQEAVPAKLISGAKPEVTFPQTSGPAIHALSPQDYRVIYNMNSLSVSGQTSIAVVGRTDLYNGGQDISDFESIFGGGVFYTIVDGPDPGDLGGGEEAEATLDSSWSVSLAPGATVSLVVSATTDTTDGIDLSEVYIIENDLAAIMTESFSACELYATDTQLAGASALAEQAAAQGITYIVSSGDDGAEGCDDPNVAPAMYGLAVNYLASTAFNVAVGGTMFNENGQDSNYWSSSAPISESALSYIPEDVWNESSLTNGLWSGSGGASAGNIQSGVGTTGGVPKPNWQYGVANIPPDGVRDLPDVSLTAASHDPYLLCLEGSCVPDSQGYIYVYFVSGTSAAAPSFAAIMALVDDQNSRTTGELRQGLANYVLYRLAATQAAYPSQCNGSTASTPPAASCIFNDVTTGNNVVPGEVGTQYPAGAGYDLATGIGSVNVGNLVSQWNSVTFNPTTTSVSLGLSTITHGSPMPFTITVAPNSGTGVPTGDVFMYASGSFGYAPVPTTIGPFALSGGAISTTTAELPGGNYFVTAGYSGDTTYAPSTSAGSNVFTVNAEPSTTAVSVLTADQFGNPIPFTGGSFGSFVYLRADVAGLSKLGIATGTVSFLDSFGAIPGGSDFALNSQGNTSNPSGIFTFDTGTHTISATYSGDSSFNPSSTTQSQSFTITPGFFAAIGTAQSTVLVSAPGSSGQTSVAISNSTGFSGTISLSCSGLPSDAACIFTPATITASGTPSTTNVSITVTTKAATSSQQQRSSAPILSYWTGGLGLLFSMVLLGGRHRRVPVGLLSLVLLLLVVLPSCGGGSNNSNHGPPPDLGTPTGVSNVLVNATSGSTASATGFTLVVQ